MKKTISEAIQAVLKKANGPMSVKDIYEQIKENEFYNFKSKSPESVVATEIRRHCENSPQLSNRKVLFVKVDNKYWLASATLPK